jgi:hypothetical protein
VRKKRYRAELNVPEMEFMLGLLKHMYPSNQAIKPYLRRREQHEFLMELARHGRFVRFDPWWPGCTEGDLTFLAPPGNTGHGLLFIPSTGAMYSGTDRWKGP